MLLPPFGCSPRGLGSYKSKIATGFAGGSYSFVGYSSEVEITYKIKADSPMFIGELFAHIKPMRTDDLLRTPNVHTIDYQV